MINCEIVLGELGKLEAKYDIRNGKLKVYDKRGYLIMTSDTVYKEDVIIHSINMCIEDRCVNIKVERVKPFEFYFNRVLDKG
jgi:hypothetical protein